MNCYEIKVKVFISYEESDGRYHYLDPRCKSWTVRDTISAVVYAWAEDEDRAYDMAISLDYEQRDFSYDVEDFEIESVELCETDDTVTEENIEVESIEEPHYNV
jgi:hypothetical protein